MELIWRLLEETLTISRSLFATPSNQPCTWAGSAISSNWTLSWKKKEWINGGLMLLIDKNTERSIELEHVSTEFESVRKQIRFSQHQRRSSAEIYIPTLAPLILSEPGEYRLASLKLMTGTKSFTKLPHDVTKCYDGDFEACKNSKLRKASLRECGCMPWALKNFTDKVDLKP